MDRGNAENQDRRAHLLGMRAHLAPQDRGRGAAPLPRATVPQPQVGQEKEGVAMTTQTKKYTKRLSLEIYEQEMRQASAARTRARLAADVAFEAARQKAKRSHEERLKE